MSAIGDVLGTGISIYQAINGNKERNDALGKAQNYLNNQPSYVIPESAKNYLAATQSSLYADNPAIRALYDQLQTQAASIGANAQKNAVSGAQALSAASNAQEKLNETAPAIAAQQAQYQQVNKGNYYNALNSMSQQELLRHESERQKAQQLLDFQIGRAGAGGAMLGQGIGGLLTLASNPNYMNWLSSGGAGSSGGSGASGGASGAFSGGGNESGGIAKILSTIA